MLIEPNYRLVIYMNTSNKCLTFVSLIIKLIAHTQNCFSTKILLTQAIHYLVF
jgi:hypothetical protein